MFKSKYKNTKNVNNFAGRKFNILLKSKEPKSEEKIEEKETKDTISEVIGETCIDCKHWFRFAEKNSEKGFICWSCRNTI